MLLVGFIIRIYHDAQSSECQIKLISCTGNSAPYVRQVNECEVCFKPSRHFTQFLIYQHLAGVVLKSVLNCYSQSDGQHFQHLL